MKRANNMKKKTRISTLYKAASKILLTSQAAAEGIWEWRRIFPEKTKKFLNRTGETSTWNYPRKAPPLPPPTEDRGYVFQPAVHQDSSRK